MKNEIQIGLTGLKNTQERRHGNVPKNSTKFTELTERIRIRFSYQIFDLEQPLDHIFMPRRESVYCGFRRLLELDEQGGLYG